MTVLENVMVGRHLHGRAGAARAIVRDRAFRAEERAIEAAAHAMLERFGLADKAHVQAGALSFGQMKILELARALASEPRLLLLDEPAAGLPDAETESLAEVIRQIPARTGALTILVDHDMSLVSSCCETTAVLDFGKLIASGPTAQVLRDERVMRAYLGTAEVA